MMEFLIDVGKVEELQVISDHEGLERIFARAKSTIVNGEKVILMRKNKGKEIQKFDEITTLEDLSEYKKRVFKYM